MILADGALGLILLGLYIFCVIDVITTPEAEMRHLPKIVWVLIVLLLAEIGSVAWLVAGRQWGAAPRSYRSDTPARAYPEYDRPGRALPADPVSDEEFLAQVRRRAESQRREYELRRRAELAEDENIRRARDDEPDR